ncbi:lytic transglycosylase domain-containing protein [Marinactinospora thermotolerans]|uniref:Membrane-bound lytic murein transglycosylase B n=1 Tax=Marinactinospora thermotolerans DSM 45154 TaxID=1122192 RepID=A0A1T4TFR9_9ACTN|nr:lytic transglycosylase domain-containing protein [Marinactinospora thermotolerans]SKA39141.1 Membrane-bound lytic murein transglycosylase B [Marinactinospora thermotolerans DSM 45154]
MTLPPTPTTGGDTQQETPRSEAARAPGRVPASWKPALAASAAVLATLGVTGAVAGTVVHVVGSAAPDVMPPGPRDQGGHVDTVTGSEEGVFAAGPSEGETTADSRPSPEPRSVAEEISPVWLDRVSEYTGVPRRALQAYAAAQLTLMEEQPSCQVSWPTLAGIGLVESVHGTYAGGEIGPDGRTTVEIIGIPLNGENNTAVIRDTDGGELDGDTVWDRAVGPMQFIPTTWARWGADGDGDGVADPHDIDDTALAAARYLCAERRVLTESGGWWEAILSYNQSEEYGGDVLDAANSYADAASRATEGD